MQAGDVLYVGGNSALKGFLLVWQLVQLQKQTSHFDKLWQKASYGFAHSSKERHDNLKGLKTFCRFIGSVCFLS